LLFDRAQIRDEPVTYGFELRVLRLRQPVGDVLLDRADTDHGVVRFAHLVADLDRQRELLLEIGVADRAVGMLANNQRLRDRATVGRQPYLVGARQSRWT